MNTKFRLILQNFLEFAIWGAYLISMGTYLSGVGLGSHIGWFYSVQGIVCIFMPALMGIIADRLMEINPTLAKEAREVLDKYKSERHIRGGLATREKYQRERVNH